MMWGKPLDDLLEISKHLKVHSNLTSVSLQIVTPFFIWIFLKIEEASHTDPFYSSIERIRVVTEVPRLVCQEGGEPVGRRIV